MPVGSMVVSCGDGSVLGQVAHSDGPYAIAVSFVNFELVFDEETFTDMHESFDPDDG